MESVKRKPLRILCLDGGGAKGMYTLGVLSEVEKALGGKLYEHYDLIYGTSTGSIIASMLALGKSVNEIKEKYEKLVPQIMGCSGQKRKTSMLRELGNKIFGEQKFDSFRTGIGIVAMDFDTQNPLVFKNSPDRAHGAKASFEPGFGLTILEAIEASCAACPIFCKKILKTANKGDITAIDGGFIANNPTLFALIDATKALGYAIDEIQLLSIGVGSYVEKPINAKWKFLGKLEMAQLASRVLVASSNTTETVTKLLFPELNIIRINDEFANLEYSTNMVEMDAAKLLKMYQLGVRSFAKYEAVMSDKFKLHLASTGSY
ncbi:patatin-like phospholipase family protein [Dyadobacter sp. LJ53]|uniref:patatin-like phospholipase family protein n=1 Tax=Dyadobacter chenwenxiniae TaxID=2906456 RepID=UPI001F2B7830|nr:patatin-like phospholipase family protein [Dyadobacter chenwenxiniae]MCF0052063.1 patatin-like phospholipase family protein [Dyadobacter chenwenxiniae]